MEISTNLKLCLLLVSSAINRCRLSQNLCRLSVSVKRFSSPTVFRVSTCIDFSSILMRAVTGKNLRVTVSDTGIGSCVEEFKSFKCAHGFIAENNSDGALSIATTRISDDEVRNYQINLMETVPARRLCVLPSQPKHGGRFSGTEVSFATAQDISGLLPEIACFLKKMQIPGIHVCHVTFLKKFPTGTDQVFSVHLQKDSIDVMVQHYIELIREDPVVANGCNPPPDTSNIERLKSGLEDYVLRHGNKSDTKCLSCFPDHRDHLKVGSGMAYCMEGQRNAGLIVEAVVVISDSIDPSSPCFREFELAKTIAGLILCSDNSDFQGECMKLLGLCSPQDQTNEKESIEACVNEKMLKAISLHDKRNHRGKEPAPLLFEDEDQGFLEPDFSTDEEDL
uniref:Uncharacterized protein n=2 Tax=Kalanchoe fedtschenkoi TaxID=63787 RepID=A0A7N0V9Q5_KALFE